MDSEQPFRAMADAAPIGIYRTDLRGHCTYTNRAWQALYGLTLEQSLGRAWASVVHVDDRERLFSELQRAADAPCEVEFRLRPADGPERSVVGRSSPLCGADGAVIGYVGTVVDVTVARELQAARTAQRVAEEAERCQAAFLSRVSHELRTPLNAILGFGQLLQLTPAMPMAQMQTYVAHVVQAGRHMLTLVDDLLELQRLQQDVPAPAASVLDLSRLLVGCAQLLAPSALAADAELVVDVPPALDVLSNERCLRQMLLNLVSNAIKYGLAGDGGTRIVLTAGTEAGRPWFSVADPGAGMTGTQLQRLFQPFERLGRHGGEQAGSGLGLVISRQLAERIGAELTLVSHPGRGTTATVRLPASAVRSAPQAALPPPPARAQLPQQPVQAARDIRSIVSETAPRTTPSAAALPDSGSSDQR